MCAWVGGGEGREGGGGGGGRCVGINKMKETQRKMLLNF